MRERFVGGNEKFFGTFHGDWNLYANAVKNPETIWVWDIDGILLNSTKVVLNDFTNKTGIKTNPAEIASWDYLTVKAKSVKNIDVDLVQRAEDGWYSPSTLSKAKKYAFMNLALDKTIENAGAINNYILTSRNPNLEEVTKKSLAKEYPKLLQENLIIRNNRSMLGSEFKAKSLWWLAQTSPWIIFVDDSTEFIKASLDAKIPNLIAVNIPQGQTWPDFSHPSLMTVSRFPKASQSMLPFLYSIEQALR